VELVTFSPNYDIKTKIPLPAGKRTSVVQAVFRKCGEVQIWGNDSNESKFIHKEINKRILNSRNACCHLGGNLLAFPSPLYKRKDENTVYRLHFHPLFCMKLGLSQWGKN